MLKNDRRESVDPENPHLASFYGTFLTAVQVGDVSRRVLIYVPEDARECTSAVYVFPPDGWSCERAFENSSWKQLADDDEHKEKLALLFLEPLNAQSWQSEQESGTGGVASYLDAILEKLEGWNPIHIDHSRNYLVGYGEGGTAAQIAAMSLPAQLAGVVSVGGRPPSAHAERIGKAPCKKLCGYTDTAWEKGFTNKQIPLPAWIIDDPGYCGENSGVKVDYWRRASGCDAGPVRIAPDTEAYCRSALPAHPENQDQAAFRVWRSTIPNSVSSLGSRLNRRIWKSFFYHTRRWDGDLEGDLRIHKDPVEDLGFSYHYQTVGGWMREWYTYVPSCVRKNPSMKSPVVFALHGYGSSGESYIGATQWYRVAEARGFILICPTATNGADYRLPSGEHCRNKPAWNMSGEKDRANEFSFFKAMLDITDSEYALDRGRVYSTGHSMGSTTTHLLGMAMPTVLRQLPPVPASSSRASDTC
jgi:poly(3-hydroxybutyrate) depolymerase